MATIAAPPKLTPEQYLTWERAQPRRPLYEYYDGEVVEMPGTSLAHTTISSNLVIEIGAQLRGRPERVLSTDLRVAVDPARTYIYPDVVAVRETPRLRDHEHDTLLNPVLIIEVLSPSTEALDRGKKFARCRRLETLEEYVLVSQDRICVEHYARRGVEWVLTVFERPEDVVRLESIGCAVPLSAIYAKVVFEAAERG